MRHIFISDLQKELLGPRGGAVEQIAVTEDPRSEFSLGQLFPVDAMVDRRPEDEEALGAEANNAEEDGDDASSSHMNQALLDAGQNFRRVPSSFGVSFVLSAALEKAEFRVCVTWARYKYDSASGWKREPFFWVDDFPGGDGTFEWDTKKELLITSKVTQLKTGSRKVSIFASSSVLSDGGRINTEAIIFQPEIRVVLKRPYILEELGEMGFHSEDESWRVSTRQYDKLKIYARGHLCGAYWKEIDPQRPFPKMDGSKVDIPFVWTDGEYFIASGESLLQEFRWPHLRTEFMPLYPAPAPSPPKQRNKDGERSMRSALNALELSESQSYDELKRRLSVLAEDYESWVAELKADPASQKVDSEIIGRHREALERIQRGIAFLGVDREAFNAFRFMNRVMSIQFAWGKKKDAMSWKPFQLAFILLSMESAVREVADREICDTIWFPTGGGKTEAYLGLACFVLAYRRRMGERDQDGSVGGDGVGVISRYTLRLLTIQQFRRALKMIMACEVLRCQPSANESWGWRPSGMENEQGMIWGRSPFSIGLWVGGAITPNQLRGKAYKNRAQGAFSALEQPAQSDESDPAQVIECPCCETKLSIPVEDIPAGKFSLKLIVEDKPTIDSAALSKASNSRIQVVNAKSVAHSGGRAHYLELELSSTVGFSGASIDRWWKDAGQSAFGVHLASFNAARPGYIRVEGGRRGAISDYEIRCPNPTCEFNSVQMRHKIPMTHDEWDFAEAHPLFAARGDDLTSIGLRISAPTVDERIVGYPPSMLISTVDKFAGLAFSGNAASLFGRVRSFDLRKGFGQANPGRGRVAVSSFSPPSLVIQDELHLLEGPLGSMFGLYETAIKNLCSSPKYVASSATIRNSREQIACLVGKRSQIFPPPNISIDDGYFLRSEEVHPLDESTAGRLFLGVAFPGRAPQTPMLRMWGRLLQTAQDQQTRISAIEDLATRAKEMADLDFFWTLIGYFNAVRELAQGEALMRQDIPQYLDKLHRQNPQMPKRNILEGYKNLSSQTGSSELPGILSSMERKFMEEGALNAVSSTSMFGTGVDVSRLSLMIVHGQPKSSSQYIQAAGRIGRSRAGLAVIFFRVSKPRDLNHYEYFTGYHRKLSVAVEPISVKPLAPKALDKAIGALLAILVRNWTDHVPLPDGISDDEGGALILDITAEARDRLLSFFELKFEEQPLERRGDKDEYMGRVHGMLEKWQDYARRQRKQSQPLKFSNSNVVVLGGKDDEIAVFDSVSRSLREVESTIRVSTRS